MTRRYADQVEVKAAAGTPELFLWRGRVYQVRAVLAHWAEARPWWQEVGRRAALALLLLRGVYGELPSTGETGGAVMRETSTSG